MLWTLPKIQVMGVSLFDPIWSQREHASTHIELLQVMRGRVELHLKGRTVGAGPGDILLIPTGAVHRDAFDPAEPFEVFMVFFRWSAEKAFFSSVQPSLLSDLSMAARAALSQELDRLRTAGPGVTEAEQGLAQARLLAVLLLLLREAQLAEEAATPIDRDELSRRRRQILVHQAKAYLEAHYDRLVGLDDIAKALRVSAYHLSHLFSKESGFTLFDYLTELRLRKARELLRKGGVTVAEVSERVGYDNANYFAKVFRRHFGIAPSEMQLRATGRKFKLSSPREKRPR